MPGIFRRRSGISSSKLGVIVRSLPPSRPRPRRPVAHPKPRPDACRGLLVVLDGVAERLGDVVGGLGHVVVLQQREEPGVGWSAAADGGLQSEGDKLATHAY